MSLLRFIALPNGKRLINLSKLSIVERDGPQIVYTFTQPVSSIWGSALWFSGNSTPFKESCRYQTEDDAKEAFDSIVNDLNKYYQLNRD